MKEEIEKSEKEQNAPILEIGKTMIEREDGDTTQEEEIKNSPEADLTTKEELLASLQEVKKLGKKTSQNGSSKEPQESKQEKREKWKTSNYPSNETKKENKKENITHKKEEKINEK